MNASTETLSVSGREAGFSFKELAAYVLLLACSAVIIVTGSSKRRAQVVSHLRSLLTRRPTSIAAASASRQAFPKWPDYVHWPAPDAEPGVTAESLTARAEPKYRPFRFGPTYAMNMGIRSLDPKEWLCLQSSYPSYAVLRAKRHQIYGERSVQILPGPVASSEAAPLSPTNPNIDQHRLAALEVARAIAWYLTNRYPSLFSAMPKGAAQRNDDGWSITSITRRDLPSTGMPEFTWRLLDEYDAQEALKAGEHVDCPMRVAGELVPDDLAIMMPESIPAADKDAFPSGVETQYRFVAGSICTAGFWRMSDKIGLTLSDIHTSGNVPQYNTKLRAPMERFFSKLRPEKPVERNNYFFQVLATKKPAEVLQQFFNGTLIPEVVDEDVEEAVQIRGSTVTRSTDGAAPTPSPQVKDMTELSWSHSTNGPETMYDMVAKGPSPAALASSNSLPFTPPTPTQDPERVVMRTERQTLRRMPRSNCILFTIRTYLVPLTTMVEEPGVPARLASAIRSWPDDVQFYKGAELYKETVLPYLDDKADLQRRNGIESRQDDELVESARKNYPF